MSQLLTSPSECCQSCDCEDVSTAVSLVSAIVSATSFINYAAARAWPSYVDSQVIAVLGATTRGDGGEGMFFFWSASVVADDGATVLRPSYITALLPGRLHRIT